MRHCASVILAVAACLLLGSNRPTVAADIDNPEYWQPAQKALAQLGDGFIVWESRRTGNLSIWTIKLDGTGLRQLSIKEPDRNHIAPHISPDGKYVAYLSFPADAESGPADDGRWYIKPDGDKVPLRIISIDGKEDRVLVDNTRKYTGPDAEGWNRAVTWFSQDELAYIGADGATYRLNIPTGKSTLLIRKQGRDMASWLPNVTLTHAVHSFNTFSILDAKTQLVSVMPHLGGCQPYFTTDGRWGFWEGACGGPVKKMYLPTRATSTFIAREILPPERNYIYFPMVSDDQRLAAFSAANKDRLIGGYGGQVKSDYDVFVAQVDPRALEIIGKPIRYTFDPANDRFPDVWQAPLPLGFYSGKAPLTVQIPAQAVPARAKIDYGDGTRGTKVRHTYSKPGLYTLVAGSKYGQAYLSPAKAPTALSAVLVKEQEIAVAFDDEVNLKNVRVAIQSPNKDAARVVKAVPGADGRTMQVVLRGKCRVGDVLAIIGVADAAQWPVAVPPAKLPIQIRIWPSDPRGLVFLWQSAGRSNEFEDPTGRTKKAYELSLHGRSWLNHNHAMVLEGGYAVAPGFDKQFTRAVSASRQFTIELTMQPTTRDGVLRPVLSLGLLEKEGHLYFKQGEREIKLVYVRHNQPNHVILTYKEGVLQCLATAGRFREKVSLDLVSLPSGPLMVSAKDGPVWQGTIEGLALYNRALSEEEIKTSMAAYTNLETQRRPVEALEFEGQVTAISTLPTVKEIQPYTRAMAVYEYRIGRIIDGACTGKTIRVAHWVILDNQLQPISQVKVGDNHRLRVEPLEGNPQLEGEKLGDTLEGDMGEPIYFATRVFLPK